MLLELSKGWDSLHTTQTAEDLSLTLQALEKFKESEELLERSLAAKKKVLHEDPVTGLRYAPNPAITTGFGSQLNKPERQKRQRSPQARLGSLARARLHRELLPGGTKCGDIPSYHFSFQTLSYPYSLGLYTSSPS